MRELSEEQKKRYERYKEISKQCSGFRCGTMHVKKLREKENKKNWIKRIISRIKGLQG